MSEPYDTFNTFDDEIQSPIALFMVNILMTTEGRVLILHNMDTLLSHEVFL